MWKFVWEIFTGFALVLGLPGTIEFYVPKVIVMQSDPVDASNAFSAAFTITNIGGLPLQDVTVGFVLGELMIGRLYPKANTPPDFASAIVPSGWSDHTLSPNERYSITPADLWSLAPGSNVEYADIAFVVFYHSWFDPRVHSVSRRSANQMGASIGTQCRFRKKPFKMPSPIWSKARPVRSQRAACHRFHMFRSSLPTLSSVAPMAPHRIRRSDAFP